MRISPLAVLALFACAAPQNSTGARPVLPEPLPDASLATASLERGVALFRHVGEETSGNLLLSPVSLSGALAPAMEASRGATRSGMEQALGLPADGAMERSGALRQTLTAKRDGATVAIANALWLAPEFRPDPAFVSRARTLLGSEVATLEFERDADGAAKRINDWAAANTNGKIPNVINPPFLGTRLVITNAVYMLADWAEPFRASDTRDAPFATLKGPVPARLMHREGSYKMVEAQGAQWIDLPYRDGRLSMTVVLPKTRGGLPALERALAPRQMVRTLAALDAAAPKGVELFLPRVQFSSKRELNEPLKALGMREAFSGRADFGGFGHGEPLHISKVLQNGFLKVDEKGTEAAAVTTVEIVVTGARGSKLPVFRADHPFLYLIRDHQTGALLFIGRVADPRG